MRMIALQGLYGAHWKFSPILGVVLRTIVSCRGVVSAETWMNKRELLGGTLSENVVDEVGLPHQRVQETTQQEKL